ncbi:oligo-1,6-glucosidase [Muribaculaceae bacterium]|nr:oligo-1,6-glucosidase [Muribaculaceae bacterium]
MQWDDTENAGFTTGTPWIGVNPNYTEINAKAETADENSVFHYYKKLIALRKQNPVMVYGKYELLLEDSEELFVYTRTLEEEKLLVVCSFSDKETVFEIPDEFVGKACLISNRENVYDKKQVVLKPYEAFVLK